MSIATSLITLPIHPSAPTILPTDRDELLQQHVLGPIVESVTSDINLHALTAVLTCIDHEYQHPPPNDRRNIDNATVCPDRHQHDDRRNIDNNNDDDDEEELQLELDAELELELENFSSFEFLLTLQQLESPEMVLVQNGYLSPSKLRDTTQGSIYEAFKDDTKLAIKRTSKRLHDARESVDEFGNTIIVNENIVREALLLQYLTTLNHPIGGYIVKFIDFFETEEDYYLVMEYAGSMNLAQFQEKAQQYLKEKRLSRTEYLKVIKFMSWQIAVTLKWMHDMMSVCHLDLCLENIMVNDDAFIINEDDKSVRLNMMTSIKLCDFGEAELFSQGKGFQCNKWGYRDSYHYVSPAVFEEVPFDAKHQDLWSFACLLFKLYTNQFLYKLPDANVDIGFAALYQCKLIPYLKTNKLSHSLNGKLLRLLLGIFTNSNTEILHSAFYERYYQEYATRIHRKSVIQKTRIDELVKEGKMDQFPVYSLD